jgi:multicomponent Na+:H+ antiporter subunit E
VTARVSVVIWLVLVWLALWEDPRPANVLSGLVIASVLVWWSPPWATTRSGRLRPLAALSFLVYFLRKLVEANLIVAWEVITPGTDRVREAIVAVPVSLASDGLVTLVANAISLTPGTLTVEVDRHPTILYVHVLHLRDVEAVRAEVLELELRAVRAFGSDAAIEAAEEHHRRAVEA